MPVFLLQRLIKTITIDAKEFVYMALPQISKWRKFYSTALTFWIPFKAYRRALRGILQLGVRKYFRVLRNDKKTKFKYELAIGAITKNEGPYIKEWIDYHILVGVQKFYIYDNESTDDTAKILKPYIKKGIVEYVYFPGTRMQNAAFIDIIKDGPIIIKSWRCSGQHNNAG